MKIRISYLEQDLLWVIDELIGGLYSINLQTFETKCEIDCKKLFPYGKFSLQSIIKWKENYIVIIPLEIDRSWIFYHKNTGDVEYRKIVKYKCRERLIATAKDKNRLYFFPVSLYEPILIVNLNTLICSQMIENWSEKVSGDKFDTAWTGTYDGQYVFYHQKNTKNLIRLDGETQNMNQIELDIPENVIDINYAFGELWVLPVHGNKLYQIDENGVVINLVELLIKNTGDFIPDFARIVVQKRYLFLLPYYRKGIYVYDKQQKEVHIISDKCLELQQSSKEYFLSYWEYYVRNNKICFLPYLDEYIEINLDTLVYKKRELLYPGIWSDEEKIQKCIWSHIYEQNCTIGETDECDLNIFLKYLQFKLNKKKISNNESIGKNICKSLASTFY